MTRTPMFGNTPKENGSSTLQRFCLAVIALLVLLPAIGWAAQTDTWHWRNPLPQGNPIAGITYANNTFVAVGSGGTILTSTDGTNWINRASGTTKALCAVSSGVSNGNSIFVAVGDGGTILTSSDGTAWSPHANPNVTSLLRGIAYGGSTFVAVADDGTILTSPDAINWNVIVSDTTFYAITYGGNTFVAVGSTVDVHGAVLGTILTSANGTVWTNNTTSYSHALYAVTCDNGIFVAVGGHGTILTSANGTTWTEEASGTTNKLQGVSHGNGIFVAVGIQGTILTSVSGTDWTPTGGGFIGDSFFGIAHGNNTFVAVGSGGVIFTSPNGTAWTKRTSGINTSLYGIAYGNNTFVAVGDGGATLTSTLTSSDGTAWTPASNVQIPARLWSVAYGSNAFVAVGDDGTILTSEDNGTTWTSIDSGVSALYAIAYGNGRFVAVGDGGTILTSTDRRVWTSTTSGYGNLNAISYGNHTFVAVGDDGTILTSSSDGTGWTLANSGVSAVLRGITYGNNSTFVAVGDSGRILTSPNGTGWTLANSGVSDILYAITYGNGTYVTVGDDGRILTSSNGANWTPVNSVAATDLRGVSYGSSTFVAVGSGGTIIQSDAPPVNGLCGSSNNGTFTVAPTANLCNAGTASSVTGTGPWTWNCIGSNGGTTASCAANIQTQQPPPSATIPLSTGWNLISLPYTPSGTAIASVLAGIDGCYTVVWGYPNQVWKYYDPTSPDWSTLTTMEAGKGYWIKMTSARTLTVSGTTPSPSISLASGWNLVGYNRTASGSATAVLSGIAGNTTVVWGYPNQVWKYYDPTSPDWSTMTTFTSGGGYWIKTTGTATWTLLP